MIPFDTDTGYHLYYDTDHQIIGLGNICCPVAHIKVSVTDFPLIYSLTSSSEGGEKLSRASHSLNFCPFCARHIHLAGFLKTLAPKDLFHPTTFFGQNLNNLQSSHYKN